MFQPKIYVHGSYIGNTGYNQHTRDFFRELSKYCKLKIRNFTIGSSWNGMSETPHDNEPYINDIDKSILYEQNLWTKDGNRENFKMYKSKDKEFVEDFNIVLNETNHHFFYDQYNGNKIGYFVWETTEIIDSFFNQLKTFDEVWVPSKWQKQCLVKQGMDNDFIKVIPEGVDSKTFFPDPNATHPLTSDNRFKFLLIGRWDYRKSTKEIIETFLKTFAKDEPVDLIVSIDNPFSNDDFKTTEDRLKYYNLEDERIKVVHFPPRKDYISLLKSSHCFVSCARGEGWNLPLIESMACGTPSIYSNCSGQLEFAEGKGIPVDIIEERPANRSNYVHFNDSVGNYYEPDFNQLSEEMRYVYEYYDDVKQKSLKESKEIRDKFDWSEIGKLGYEACLNFYEKTKKMEKKNTIEINYLEGPKVEIKGELKKKYLVEFLDENDNVIHSSEISNNMWTQCSRKYYTKWKIKIDGTIIEEFSLDNKTVLISLESKSIGDTLAWSPYAVEFSKKHNCNVVLSTFHNEWFIGLKEYENIKFINPGQSVKCNVVYRIGWFKDEKNGWKKFDCYPNQVNIIPLQKTATDILGLEYKELNFGVNYKIGKRPIEDKYVVIGPNATAGCKEWIYENWVTLSKMIRDSGYKVISLTSHEFKIDGVINIHSKKWGEVFNVLHHSELFIGLGSGLSWVNWSLNKKTVMINGFTVDGHEFTNNLIRVTNNVCIKCWNDPVLIFDGGDWDWCPVYKGTELQHICQKSITPQQVFDKLGI